MCRCFDGSIMSWHWATGTLTLKIHCVLDQTRPNRSGSACWPLHTSCPLFLILGEVYLSDKVCSILQDTKGYLFGLEMTITLPTKCHGWEFPDKPDPLLYFSVLEEALHPAQRFLLCSQNHFLSSNHAPQLNAWRYHSTWLHEGQLEVMISRPAWTPHSANNCLALPKAFQFKAVYVLYNNTRSTNVFFANKDVWEQHSSSICNITLIAGNCNHCQWMAPKWQTIKRPCSTI